MSDSDSRKDDCYECEHRRDVPGSYHIRCNNPDPKMTGKPHGITNGWFYYPALFDPIWKASECANFQCKESACVG